MIVWTALRGQGKSDALIHWALQNPEHRVVVVLDETRARHMRERAFELYGPSHAQRSVIIQVIVAGMFAVWQRGRHDLEVAVDEVGDLLRTFLGVVPDVVTGPVMAVPVQRAGDLVQQIAVGQVWRRLDGKRVVRVERYHPEHDEDCSVRNLVNGRRSVILGRNLRSRYALVAG